MNRVDIQQWIVASFAPLQLAVQADTIDQVVDLSIAYWNTHSAHKVVKMFPLTPNAIGNGAIQLDNEIKMVVNCYPSTMTESLFTDHPMWVLLGFIALDRYTQDLMLLSHTFEGYRIYLGNDFRWKYERAMDSETGGWLFYQKVPWGASKIAVVGTKRIVSGKVSTSCSGQSGALKSVPIQAKSLVLTNGTTTFTDDGLGVLTADVGGFTGTIDYVTGAWSVTGWTGAGSQVATYNYDEDITNEFIYNWIRQHARATVKMYEGAVIRKGSIIGIANDGSDLVTEGKEEKKELEEQLRKEARWVLCAVRK